MFNINTFCTKEVRHHCVWLGLL